VAPDPFFVELAAKLLRSSRQPLIICGGGVLISGAEAELAELAEKLGAPVATTVSGKGAIDERSAHAAGVVGSNGGTRETRAVVDAADVIVFVGCRAGSVTTERWRHPAPGGAKIIHIDVDPAVPGRNYPVDVPLVGDARLALCALSEALGTYARGRNLSFVEAKKREKFAAFEALAASGDVPVKPERVVAELGRLLGDDAILVADPGTPCPYFSAFYQVRGTGRRFFSNRAHGALGYALAASVGAHLGRPQVKTVAVMGDGSFGMCVGELETVVRLKLPITFVVIANAVYGWIKAGQKSGYGARYFSVDFGITDHARVAEAFGVKSFRVVDPGKLSDALKQAISHGGPALVDVVCQPLHEARAPVSEWVA
jgi:acetolactate synthase-1/2/3 large subunit